MSRVRVGVVGARGYTGGELLRLIGAHPGLELSGAFGTRDERIGDAHPSLRGVVEGEIRALSTDPIDGAAELEGSEAVFLATPHEVSAALAPELVDAGVRVFDLSGAFRLESSLYPLHYGFEHPSAGLLREAVYGLAEWNADAIGGARLVAVAGCYATAAALSIRALAGGSLLRRGSAVTVTGISGISGAGRGVGESTQFGSVSLGAYKALSHRHEPEIGSHSGLERGVLRFVPHVAPFFRGLVTTAFMDLADGVEASDVQEAMERAYADKPLVRLLEGMPSVAGVERTSFADIGWVVRDGGVVVSCAIDNLLKGASGQAVQCLNLAYGFGETEGLLADAAGAAVV